MPRRRRSSPSLPPAAEDGSPSALNAKALAFWRGHGCPVDEPMALDTFRKAIDAASASRDERLVRSFRRNLSVLLAWHPAAATSADPPHQPVQSHNHVRVYATHADATSQGHTTAAMRATVEIEIERFHFCSRPRLAHARRDHMVFFNACLRADGGSEPLSFLTPALENARGVDLYWHPAGPVQQVVGFAPSSVEACLLNGASHLVFECMGFEYPSRNGDKVDHEALGAATAALGSLVDAPLGPIGQLWMRDPLVHEPSVRRLHRLGLELPLCGEWSLEGYAGRWPEFFDRTLDLVRRGRTVRLLLLHRAGGTLASIHGDPAQGNVRLKWTSLHHSLRDLREHDSVEYDEHGRWVTTTHNVSDRQWREAVAGDPVTMHTHAISYMFGHGRNAAKDPAAAALWLRRALESGHPSPDFIAKLLRDVVAEHPHLLRPGDPV